MCPRAHRTLPQVTEKLRERLGAGWVVEEMTHDDSRHPCELVEELASVDVLLTAHGFQVRVRTKTKASLLVTRAINKMVDIVLEITMVGVIF